MACWAVSLRSTAGCDVLSTQAAVFLGLTGGIVQLTFSGTSRFLTNVAKVDDAVSAIAVHGFAGAWGTIMLAVLMPSDLLATDTRLGQIGVQTFGVVIGFIWAFALAYLTFWLMDKTMGGGLRVSREDELVGLNEAEHGTTLGTGVLLNHMLELSSGDADLSTRLEEGARMKPVSWVSLSTGSLRTSTVSSSESMRTPRSLDRQQRAC